MRRADRGAPRLAGEDGAEARRRAVCAWVDLPEPSPPSRAIQAAHAPATGS